MTQRALERPASLFPLLLTQAFMVLFLFLALLYDVRELTLFTLLILALGAGSYLWSRASLLRVTCTVEPNRRRLFPGETLNLEIVAVNAKPLPVLFGVELFVPGAIEAAGAGETGRWISESTGLLWYGRSHMRHELQPARRGVFDLGPPALGAGDLFGFFFRYKGAAEGFEIVVYPRIVRLRPAAIPKREFYGIPGAKSPVNDPIYLFGTRDYQPGSPARGIHWKASARHHRLQEKLCEPAAQEKVLLLLDVDQFEGETTDAPFEKCLEVIGSLVLQLDLRGIAVGFATNARIHGRKTRIWPISRSPGHMQAILETLARASAEKDPEPLTNLLSRGYTFPWGVSCLYFALRPSARTRSAGAFMEHRGIPALLVWALRPNAAAATGAPAAGACCLDDLLLEERGRK